MAAPKGNKFALGLTNSGRPPIYESTKDGAELMYNNIVNYFDYIQGESHEVEVTIDKTPMKQLVWDRHPEPPTITGLTLYLGFSNKSTLYDYAKKKEFSNSIKRALTFVEKNYEMTLFTKASTGAIFALKNMEWKDKTEQDLTIKSIEIDFKD